MLTNRKDNAEDCVKRKVIVVLLLLLFIYLSHSDTLNNHPRSGTCIHHHLPNMSRHGNKGRYRIFLTSKWDGHCGAHAWNNTNNLYHVYYRTNSILHTFRIYCLEDFYYIFYNLFYQYIIPIIMMVRFNFNKSTLILLPISQIRPS